MSSSPSRLPVYKHSLRRHVPSHVHAAALEPPREHSHARSVSVKSGSSNDSKTVQGRRSKRERAKESVEHFFDKFHHHDHDQHDHDRDHGAHQQTKGSKIEEIKRTSSTSKRHSFFHFTGHHNDLSEGSKNMGPAADREANNSKRDTLDVEVSSLHYQPTSSHSPASSVEDVKLAGLAAETKGEKVTAEPNVGDTVPVFPIPMIIVPPAVVELIVGPTLGYVEAAAEPELTSYDVVERSEAAEIEEQAVSMPIPEPYSPDEEADAGEISSPSDVPQATAGAEEPFLPALNIEPAPSVDSEEVLNPVTPFARDELSPIAEQIIPLEAQITQDSGFVTELPLDAVSPAVGIPLQEVAPACLPVKEVTGRDSESQTDQHQTKSATLTWAPSLAAATLAVSAKRSTSRQPLPLSLPQVSTHIDTSASAPLLPKFTPHMHPYPIKKPSWIRYIYNSFIKPVVVVAMDCTVAALSYGLVRVLGTEPVSAATDPTRRLE